MKSCSNKITEPDVQFFSAVKELPSSWDQQLNEHHFLHSRNLIIAEEAHFPHVQIIYVLIIRDGVKYAQGQFMLLHIVNDHLKVHNWQKWKVLAWKGIQRVARPKLLVSGHLFRHDVESILFNTDEPYEQYRLYAQMLETVIQNHHPQAVLLKDVPEQLARYFHQFDSRYMMLRNDIAMHMNLHPEWKSFKDYEQSLKHKYAQRARKVRKAFKSVVVKELSIMEVEERQMKLHELYLQVTERQKATLGYISPQYLPLLKNKDPFHFKVWAFYEQGEIVAFASAWVKEDKLDMFYIGLDYSYNQSLQLYFNLLFFVLEQAILLGVTQLILGRTALEAKARLGCKPQYLSTMLMINNPVLRFLYRSLQERADQAEGEWEQRHPFKEISEGEHL